MTYTVTQSGIVSRDSDGAHIPADPANTDYAAYLMWVAAGNIAAQLPEPPMTWIGFQQLAQAELSKSDLTMARIGEAVALGLNSWSNADVVAWASYRRALRAIVTSASGTPSTLPSKPNYPKGT